MPRFRISLRVALAMMFLLALGLSIFRCQILVVADNLLGTQLTPRIKIVDSDADLMRALENENCILLVSHDWSIQDAIIRKELSEEIACNRKLGRFTVFLISTTDPSADNGASDAMYTRLDNLCGTNGDLPKFHWFHNSSGFVFLKSGDKIEWKNHVGTFENLKTLALNHPQNDG